MPVEAKPLFRPDVLRPYLATRQPFRWAKSTRRVHRSVAAVAFDRSGRILSMGSEGVLKTWDGNTILVGLKEVWSHKFRSLLTMLGIILGVASLVGMAAIIKGMENGGKRIQVIAYCVAEVGQQETPGE